MYCLTLRGWPHCWQQVPRITRHLWRSQDELSIEASLLLKEIFICIPLELLHCILADLHGVHQVIDKMQAQVREAVYWPSINADIVNYIFQCTIFTSHKASPPAQPMLPRHIANGPWQEITANYLTHKGKEYSLICDLFSKYPFLYKFISKSAHSVSQCLQVLLSQYRLPSLIYTDNGPPFTSDELSKFLQHNYIDYITSSPHLPESKDFIKQKVKTALSTLQESGKSLQEFLLDPHSTLNGPNMPSSREILHNRTFQHPGKPLTLSTWSTSTTSCC